MDILELIRVDHRQLEALFLEIENTDDVPKLYKCFNQLYQALNLHAEVEEQTFYPALRDRQNVEKLVDEAQVEHEQAKEMLEDISSLSPNSAEFKTKISALKQAIQHHVQQEENKIFAQVQELMTTEEREQLGNKFTSVKSLLESEISVAT